MITYWRTMYEWQTSGPPNGKPMLVLLADERRYVATFDGFGRVWKADDRLLPNPIAWAPIPEVPVTLTERNARIVEERKKLDALAASPLDGQS